MLKLLKAGYHYNFGWLRSTKFWLILNSFNSHTDFIYNNKHKQRHTHQFDSPVRCSLASCWRNTS